MLGDKEIVAAIYEALAKRHPQSRTRGQPGFFAHHLSAIALEVKTKTIGDTHAELLAGYVGDIQKGRASHSASGLVSPDHPSRDDQVATRWRLARMALAAWSTSIIMARWKWRRRRLRRPPGHYG